MHAGDRLSRARHSRAGAVLVAVGIVLIAIAAAARGATPGTISTVAGQGPPATSGYSGDGGAATAAKLNSPRSVAPTPDGGFLIADGNNNVIRKVSATGVISTVAGQGPPATSGYSGDGGPATAAQLNTPRGVALTADGGFLFADANNNVIRKVSPSGIISTVAGQGPPAAPGYSGDGGAATAATLNRPYDVALAPDGGFLIADHTNNVIRKVSPSGIISTVAGQGPPATSGYSGDGGPATAAQLNTPTGVVPTADGGFLIADEFNNVIRKVSAAGIISTVAGQGPPVAAGYAGDGGAATAATLNGPFGVAPTPDGGFLFSEFTNNVIRKVSPSGIISTVAGQGPPATSGYSGDGGPATAAKLSSPEGVKPTCDGSFLTADFNNNVIRSVAGGGSCTLAFRVKGTKLLVTVTAPGTVTVSGIARKRSATAMAAKTKHKKKQVLLKTTSATGGPGRVTVQLRLSGKAKQTFKRTGKVRVPAKITFSPHAAFLSFARTETAKLKIKKGHKHKKK